MWLGLIVVAALLAVPGLFVGRALLPGRTLLPIHPAAFEPLASEDAERAALAVEGVNHWVSDATLPFATDVLQQQQRRTAGEPAHFAPNHGLGRALQGGTLIDPMYAPNRLLTALPVGRGIAALGWLHLAIAGIGMWLLLGARGVSAGGRFAGALAIQAGGFGLMNLQLSMKVGAIAWVPLALWAVEGMLAGRLLARIVLAVAIAMTLSAGFPSIAVPALAAVVLVAIVRAIREGATGRLPAIGVTLILGGLLGGPALVPMAFQASDSARQPAEASELIDQGLPRAALATMMVPDLFGGPDDPFFADANPPAWWVLGADERKLGERANGLEWNLYVGVATLLLAIAGIAGRPRKSEVPFLLIVCGVGFAFAWYPFRWLLHVPGFDLGAPTRATALVWIGLPWLAALGAGALIEGCRRATLATLMAALALTTGGIMGMTVTGADDYGSGRQSLAAERFEVSISEVEQRLPPDLVERAVEGWQRSAKVLTIQGGIALALLGLGFALRKRKQLGWTRFALISVVVLADGALIARTHLAPRELPGPLFPDSPGMDAIARATGAGRMARLVPESSGPAGVERLARPDLPSAYGIADLAPYAVFTPRTEVELIGTIDPLAPTRSGTGPFQDERILDHRGLDLLRVTSIVSLEPLDHKSLTPVLEREGFHVYARDDAWPEGARVYSRVNSLHETFLGGLAANEIDPMQVLCIEDKALRAGEGEGDFDPGTLNVKHPTSSRIEVQVTDSDGGWLVLPIGYSSGWKAKLDGLDEPVHRAQLVLTAVRIPPGTSHVKFVFEPPGLRLGRLLGGVAAIVLILSLGIGAIRQRRAHA
tara:strand:+ start:6396 stop:8870 length:2475 start_codon:yes stop_codon:yes gene_type:complete